MSLTRWRPVVIETPYAGDIERNLAYLRECMADCIARGETPYASHGLLTQPGVLDDADPDERARGIEAGFAMAEALARVGAVRVVYVDLGISSGMEAGIEHAKRIGQEVWYRTFSHEDGGG